MEGPTEGLKARLRLTSCSGVYSRNAKELQNFRKPIRFNAFETCAELSLKRPRTRGHGTWHRLYILTEWRTTTFARIAKLTEQKRQRLEEAAKLRADQDAAPAHPAEWKPTWDENSIFVSGLDLSLKKEDITEIPRNVEILGSSCFPYCESLSSISFESNSRLIRIESSVFSSSSLQSIKIQRNVEILASSCFSFCSSL
jgi:hypothetical protein